MLFNSIDFLIFFPVVVVIFFLIPKKLRYIWLLIASYFFYMSWNPKYALLIAASTVITYASGILIERYRRQQREGAVKLCVAASLISNLGILFVFKYGNFLLTNMSSLLANFGITFANRHLDLLLPVGISFYTFQALGYTIDVYHGTSCESIKAEKNILKYALFVSFFPQLVAGPIERSKNLLRQIQNIEAIQVWNFDRVRNGFFLMMWGLFQKLVIADRASLLVNNVVNHYQKYGFVELLIAMILFAFQIYCDFGGYTNIARGAAQVMGFSLTNNFRQPYLAVNIKDFWRRWHISLTSWFTDYLYIPLGGNRKGTIRKYLNIFVVFGISGLWHGASWNFVVWGVLHGLFLIFNDIKEHLSQFKEKPAKKVNHWKKSLSIIATFFVVDFAWIFFVSKNLDQAIGIIKHMTAVWKTSRLTKLGIDGSNWNAFLFGIIVLFVVDYMHERNISVFKSVAKLNIVLRWFLYLGLVWFTIMLGIYGAAYDTSTFIYFQF
ncbi:MAG: MBOAT family protein [Acidaminococcaceae bacterium]|nr:MBOAT family protein [Acidaminococcaceae bacterium]